MYQPRFFEDLFSKHEAQPAHTLFCQQTLRIHVQIHISPAEGSAALTFHSLSLFSCLFSSCLVLPAGVHYGGKISTAHKVTTNTVTACFPHPQINKLPMTRPKAHHCSTTLTSCWSDNSSLACGFGYTQNISNYCWHRVQDK